MFCPRCPSKGADQVSVKTSPERTEIVYRCPHCHIEWRETTTREVINAPTVPA